MPKEETYNPLKLPHYDTYVPLDKQAYVKALSSIKPKIASFRRVSQGDMARQQKFIDEEDDKFKDNPLFDSKAANSSAMRSNNLYRIKLKVDAQMKINQDAQKREQAANTKPKDGPLSKENFDRFAEAVRVTQHGLGARNIARINEEQLYSDVIKEETQDDEDQEFEMANLPDDQNPLISNEYIKVIEAAIPKYTMQQLLGLSNAMYLTLKNT